MRNYFKFIIIMLIFAFFVIEVFIRIACPAKYPNYSWIKKNNQFLINGLPSHVKGLFSYSDYYSYVMKKNLNVEVTDLRRGATFHYKTNSEGFRYIKEHPGSYPIMVLGDSVTFGSGVNDSECYPAQLNSLFGKKYTVYNYGVSGWGFAEYFLTYKRYIKKVKPKLLIIGVFAGNDFKDLLTSFWKGKDDEVLPNPPLVRLEKYYYISYKHHPETEYVYRWPILRYSNAYVFLMRHLVDPIRLKKYYKKYMLSKENCNSKNIAFKIISNIEKNIGCKVLVLFFLPQHHYSKSYPREYIEFKQGISKLKNVYVLDFFSILKKQISLDKTLYIDNAHFSPKGNKLVARHIYEFIMNKKLLK